MDVSIIIISFNTAQLTKQCIESIFNQVTQNPELANKLELIIVDNHSIDDSIETITHLKKSAPIPLALLANASNVGFAAANNQAMLHAKGKFVLLLNSDTVVLPKTFELLITTMNKESSIGILSASLVNADGSAQSQGGDIPTLFSLLVFAFMLDDIPLIGKLLPSHQHTGRRFQPSAAATAQFKGWVGGTAMMIRSELVPQIGMLDEHIFMYAEDLEYCWRAQKAGLKSAIDSTATIRHLGSKSSSSANAIIGEFTSLKYVLRKHLPKWQHTLALSLLKLAACNRKLLFGMIDTAKAGTYASILSSL